MSSSPDPQKTENAYQSSEASDHGLLTHTCTCSDKSNYDPTKTENVHCLTKTNHHHHHAISPTISHMHPNVHVHPSPKTSHTSKVATAACTCHVQDDGETGNEIDGGAANRKTEADDRIEVSPLPPALPPRPPPRPRYDGHGSINSRYRPMICE